ncbi:MAG: ABC transporter substrate-binding protein, partial [Myxococcales bacterium]
EVIALAPDLILVNQEENSRRDVERLMELRLPVYIAFPRRVAEGIGHLAMLARLLGIQDQPLAKDLIRRGYHALRQAEQARGAREPLRVFCPIWMDPLMTIHGDTYMSDMLELAGARNVFNDRPRRYPLAADLGRVEPLSDDRVGGRDTRYPRVTLDELVARAPEAVILPDEPHPFSASDADVFRGLDIPAARAGAVVTCDGRDLSWYGSRSVEGLERVKKFIDSLRSRVDASSPSG